ncbi:hypothetical protein E1B28_011472 [Marasmius oreades]|uniref:Protein kinase domain-containing protein n=1 Tax=Marasmius oreades TaxID=181124 RepID=A0A9P7US44_9AGAR|nr:uncharacterized protein E1B28_011472 [Marasmius oreades]KAG7089824.1 hypothetical protein E1B28_011472 [Marasmius oreades]
MIHSKPSDLPSYTVSSPFRRSHGHVPLDRDYRSLFKIHSKELNNFLGTHTAQGVLYTARKTLNSLTRAQLYEHSEDVCDEVLRRTSLRDLVSYLSARPEFHPKRNQARAKLSALLDDRLKDLISDVCLEIDRRYPTHFPKARLDNSHDRNAITIHQKVTPSLAEKPYVAGVQGKNDTIGNDFAVPTEMILKEYENKDVSSEALAEPLELQSHVALLPFTGRKTDKDDLMDSSAPSTSTIKRQSPLSPSSSDSYKNNSIPSVNESHRGLRKCLQTKEGCEKELAHLGVVLEDEQQRRKIVNKIGEDAQFWLDLLQSLVDYPGISQQLRTTMFTIMVHLSKKSGLYPECLMIHNVRKIGEHPVGGGGFGDVWEGVLDSSEGSPQKVCLKVIRVFRDSPMEQLLKGCLREAIVWRQLKHPNVLPFLGIYYLDDTHRRLSLVSPWMEKGNLMEFLQATPWKSVNHHLLASDVAAGLCYLHSMKIVHGDLKAVSAVSCTLPLQPTNTIE